MRDRLATEVSAALKRLLETKHLYQSETVDVSFIEQQLRAEDQQTAAALRGVLHPLRDGRWIPWEREVRRAAFARETDAFARMLWFYTPTIKTFCEKCTRIEAFNPLLIEDLLEKSGDDVFAERGIQIFALTLLCQSCKSIPEAFLVRRNRLKLTLSGRSPIEHVTVPADIPKNQRIYYSGAMVAYQSGQVLAGLFLLRTLIEQFVRERFGKPAETPEAQVAAFAEYMAALPESFRATFPSLPDLYGRLSVALHAADSSAELFESVRASVVKHFEARRLFELP